jgi:chitinase
MIRVLALLAAILAAAFAVQGSQATFTASKTNAGSAFTTVAKFAPVVTLTAPANGSATNDTTPTLSGAAGNTTGDNLPITVKIYSGASATGTPVQTRTPNRTAATWTTTLTTALAVGTYTAQATQTDTSGNTGTSAASTFTVDTTKPAATRVVAANKTGGTAGKIESGDTITFTYSEPITAASVWSGWGGTSATVRVRFTDVTGNADTFTVLDAASAANVKLGTVATNGNYVSANTTFDSTMVRSADGASIVVTLGTPASVQGTAVTAKNMTWTPVIGITDLAGNTSTTAPSWTETVSSVDF